MHFLVIICNNISVDIYYIRGKWKKPCVNSKLKGMTINSMTWNRQQINEGMMTFFPYYPFLNSDITHLI
jgi:hypothetical protein